MPVKKVRPPMSGKRFWTLARTGSITGTGPWRTLALIEILRDTQTPLTNCPLSNLALCVIDDLKKSPLKAQLEAGLLVTVNSDDPAYFGGYIGKNFEQISEALDLSPEQIIQLAKNSFTASFLPENVRSQFIREIEGA
jgi:adenosine deaminase